MLLPREVGAGEGELSHGWKSRTGVLGAREPCVDHESLRTAGSSDLLDKVTCSTSDVPLAKPATRMA